MTGSSREQDQSVIAINCREGTRTSVPLAVYILTEIRYRAFIFIKIVVSKCSAQIQSVIMNRWKGYLYKV
jgi:hypothetical protein